MTTEEPWVCPCGETDVTKHDLGMAIAHAYGLDEQKGRDILVGIRDRLGVDTADEDRTVDADGTGGDDEGYGELRNQDGHGMLYDIETDYYTGLPG